MSGSFVGSVMLKGANGKVARVRCELGKSSDFGGITEEANFGMAQTALDQIVGALDDVTDAKIVKKELSFIDGAALSQDPPAEGDIFEKAAVTTFLEVVVNEPQDDHTFFIPAPKIGVFLGATGELRDEIDATDGALQQYVQQVAQHAYDSDHEKIDDGRPNMGIKNGRRVVSRYNPGN